MEHEAVGALAPELERGLEDILARGGCVFPICSNSKLPLPLPGRRIGKPGKGGYKLATNDPRVVWQYFRGDPVPSGAPDIVWKTLATWRTTAQPNAAVALDMSGLLVLDADNMAELAELREQHGEFPRTYCVRSPREQGGLHFYFRAPQGVNYRKTVNGFPHLDIKHRGYVLIPGSVKRGRDGSVIGRYSVVDASPVADPPTWLMEMIERPPLAPMERGNCDNEWGNVYGMELERAKAYLAKMPAAVSGHGGHNATFAAACALVRGFALSEEDAYDILVNDYNPRCEPPWAEWELRHKIQSAMDCGGSPLGYLLESREREPEVLEAEDIGRFDIPPLWDEPKNNDDWGNA